jgi:hypothetical protein
MSDGGSTYLWNVGWQLFYTVVHPRRQFWTLCCYICSSFNDAFVSSSDYIAWNERMWKEAVVAKFKVLSQRLPGGIKENHEKLVRMVSLRAEFEPESSRIRNRSVNHWTMTFGVTCCYHCSKWKFRSAGILLKIEIRVYRQKKYWKKVDGFSTIYG